MKVLGIVCSPRLQGNTEILAQHSLAKAQECGAEVELVTLAGKSIAPCDGCLACYETGECRIEDDMQAIYTKLLAADGIIFGTPVYFWSVSALAKAVIDRTYALYVRPNDSARRRLRNKVAGVVVTTGREGGTSALMVFSGFFTLQRMIMVGGAIGIGGRQKGVIRQDERAMSEAGALGRAVVRRIQAIKSKTDETVTKEGSTP